MASLLDIAKKIDFPRIPAIAGTPEESKLITLWRWGIMAQVYSYISVNNFAINATTVQGDVNEIWRKALAFIEKERNGEADIIELFPFLVDHAITRMAGAAPSLLERPIELTDVEQHDITTWVRKGLFYTIVVKTNDAMPAADGIERLVAWVDGKILRDFGSNAREDARFLIAVSLQTMKSVLAGTLKLKFEPGIV